MSAEENREKTMRSATHIISAFESLAVAYYLAPSGSMLATEILDPLTATRSIVRGLMGNKFHNKEGQNNG